jgi:RNA polymerase sigma-70 factor (ECF subfamily)
MSADPLDGLLDRLCGGDAAAVEQVFVAYEPYLRMVVRRQLPPALRAKFDSADILQSVWADLVHGFREAGWRFADAAHLRAFLVQVTRHRFIDRLRQHRTALGREQALAEPGQEEALPGAEPPPSEVAQAEELWERMLALSPPTHQEVLRLRRQGWTLAEVAARTGLHPSSVRRILYDLARRLGGADAPRQPGPEGEGPP